MPDSNGSSQQNVCTGKQKLKRQILFSAGNDYHYKKISYILEGQETKEYFIPWKYLKQSGHPWHNTWRTELCYYILTCGILDPGNFCSWNPGILGFGIRNPAKDRIRNPSSTDKESGLQYMDPESMAWNPNSETVLDFLSWRYLNIKKQPLLFSFHLPPLLFLCAFPLNTPV